MIHAAEPDVGQDGRDLEVSRARGGNLDSSQAEHKTALATIDLGVKTTIMTRERGGIRSQQMPIVRR